MDAETSGELCLNWLFKEINLQFEIPALRRSTLRPPVQFLLPLEMKKRVKGGTGKGACLGWTPIWPSRGACERGWTECGDKRQKRAHIHERTHAVAHSRQTETHKQKLHENNSPSTPSLFCRSASLCIFFQFPILLFLKYVQPVRLENGGNALKYDYPYCT